MSIHKIVPDWYLPECLKKRIVFGNREQLNAYRKLEQELKCITTKKARETGNLNFYKVTVELHGELDMYVLADSEYDAENEAGYLRDDDIYLQRDCYVKLITK